MHITTWADALIPRVLWAALRFSRTVRLGSHWELRSGDVHAWCKDSSQISCQVAIELSYNLFFGMSPDYVSKDFSKKSFM